MPVIFAAFAVVSYVTVSVTALILNGTKGGEELSWPCQYFTIEACPVNTLPIPCQYFPIESCPVNTIEACPVNSSH